MLTSKKYFEKCCPVLDFEKKDVYTFPLVVPVNTQLRVFYNVKYKIMFYIITNVFSFSKIRN